jgi:protoporphyrinogen oxidase
MKRIIGNIDPENRNVSIWGAGFSGLVLGYYLKDQGYNVTIHEKSNKVGGKIQTIKTGPGLAETAANALYLNQDGLDLLKELKLEPLPATKKLKRLIFLKGKPRKPFQLSLFGKIAANSYKKPPLISDGLTVADFFRPLLGEENLKHYLSPALGGLYAVPAERLHFKSIFPIVEKRAQFDSYFSFLKMFFKHQKNQPKLDISGSVSFEGGMQTLINRLAEVLKHDIKLNSKEKPRLNGNTVICTDAISASELIKDLRPEISRELQRIEYRPLSSTTLFLKREIRSLQKAFGVLIPLDNGFNSIGILNNKAIFPANNQNLSAYTLISPQDLTREEILSDLKLLAPEITDEDIQHLESTYWSHALPIYNLQLFLAIKKLHQLCLKEKNLAFFGNYVAGISLRDMISSAKSFARNPTDLNNFHY